MADPHRDFPWPSSRRDFAGEDLRYHRFVGIQQAPGDPTFNFSGVGFRGALFRDSTFHSADFGRSDFSECDVERTQFIDCRFGLFGFHTSRLRGVAVVGAEARDGAIIQSIVEESSFLRSDWRTSNMYHNQFSECAFEELDLAGAAVHHNRYQRCRFRGLDLTAPLLNYCIFDACSFEDVALGVDALEANAGWTLEELADARIMRGNERLSAADVTRIMAETIAVRASRGEMLEAANAAMLLDRVDVLERLLEELPTVLRTHPATAASDQWTNLGRNLLHWTAQGRVHPYWLGWVFRALVEHARISQREARVPLYQLSEAARQLAGPVQAYQAEVARVVLDELPVRMDAMVRLTLEAPGDASPEDVLAWVALADAEAAAQVPAAFQREGRVLRLEYVRHRRGSLFVDLQGWMVGAAIASAFLMQAGILLRSGQGALEHGGRLVEGAAHTAARTIRAVRRAARDAFGPLDEPPTPPPAEETVPTPNLPVAAGPSSIFAAKGGAARALDLITHRNTSANLLAGVSPSPELRRRSARLVLSVEIHLDDEPMDASEGP